jgi:hypothetical protein
MRVFAEHFPDIFEKTGDTILRPIFLRIFFSQSLELHGMATKALTAVLRQKKLVSMVERLGSQISQFISNIHDTSIFDSLCRVIAAILQTDEKYIQYFNLKMLPLNLLDSKDTLMRSIALRNFPLCWRLGSRAAHDRAFLAILKMAEPCLKRKSPGRNDALFGLGSLAFEQNGLFGEDAKKIMKRYMKLCEEDLTTDAAVFCYAALLTGSPDQLQKASPSLFSLPLSVMVTDACRRLAKIVPSQTDFLSSKIQSFAFGTLLDFHSKPANIATAFSCLAKFDFKIGDFPLDLILQLSLHMANGDFLVRKVASDFILDFHERRPTTEVLQRVFAVVSTEVDEAHRIWLLMTVKREPWDARVLSVLQGLLRDSCREVRREALRRVTELAATREGADTLTSFLTEKVTGIGRGKAFAKDQIECFLIFAECSEKSPFAKELLVPFAELLVKHLQNVQQPSTGTIRLLAKVLGLAPHAADTSKLSSILGNSLLIHSSANKRNAARDLLRSALETTGFKFSIYKEHHHLISKLIELSIDRDSAELRQDGLKSLGSIGAVGPSLLTIGNTDHSDEVVTSTYIPIADYEPKSNEENVKLEAVTCAAVHVSSLNLLDILLEESF